MHRRVDVEETKIFPAVLQNQTGGPGLVKSKW